jgi:hypothetical protein
MRKGMLAAVLLCGACGGGSSSPASVSGNIGGQSMNAQDAVSGINTVGTNSVAGILITNVANTCSMLTAHQQPRNAKAILIAIGTQNGLSTSAPTSTGTYPVFSPAGIVSARGNVAIAAYGATDANCVTVSRIDATSGTVTLTRVDSSGYAGTFDITFSDSSHVTGSFTASNCAAITSNVQGTCT